LQEVRREPTGINDLRHRGVNVDTVGAEGGQNVYQSPDLRSSLSATVVMVRYCGMNA
jgi:hypothetical protein